MKNTARSVSENDHHREKSLAKIKLEATLDVLLGFTLAFLIFRNFIDPVYLFVMVIAAQLPDWLEAPAAWFNVKIPPFSWMDWLGHKLQSRMQLPWGLVTQVVIVVIFVFVAVGAGNFGQILAASTR